jgi:uncharacterized membrane protein
MRVNVATKITIAAPAREVFRYLTDLKYTHLWNPQIKQLSSKKVLKLNSTYETTSQVLGITIQSVNVVTKYIPNKELQIENNTGTVHYRANFRLVPKTPKSLVLTCTTTVSSDYKAFAFSGPVLKLLARRELQTDLQALKIAVEHQVPGLE